jgi:hypothetical protein
MNRAVVILALASVAGCSPATDRVPIKPSAGSTASSGSLAAAGPDSTAVAFVRSFYQTYGPRSATSGLAAVDSLLVERPALFTPELLAALRRDAAARAAVKGEIDGLDWEPFLNTQDPCEQYVVGTATRAASHVRVRVYAICRGRRSDSVAVVADVTPVGSSWAFANFLYGAPAGDLLTALHALHP